MEFDLQLIKEGSLRSNEYNNGEKRKISSKNGLKDGSLRVNECSNGEKRKHSVKNGVKEGSLRVNECKGGEKSKDGEWSVEEIDELPWKGGSESNPDYECLRAELRKMAPPNGKAVLLFRAKCGCPLAKLEGWGTGAKQRGKRLKKLNIMVYMDLKLVFVVISFQAQVPGP
ncbi:hypothetical protein Leryth_020574 [Lithospermum erythrorhizon]|nr:hypothetical protein Leryth_020574 [Lithospermum erythrorhizon]